MLNLNSAQSTAVTALDQTILVLAGAGSGKTRVLTQRIGWLIRQGIPINKIMAVTFTNKAVNEMRHRLEQMLGINLKNMWLGTFHSLAHRFLRLHYLEANLDQNFQIIDADDQLRLIRRIHKNFNLSEEKWQPKQSQLFINKNKEACIRPIHLRPTSPIEATLLKVYQAYAENCQRGNLVDFSELLLRAYEILHEKPELLAHYKQRFNHILVDEFQDTNSLQYIWIKTLALDSANLMAVGDDDQSIYGWRGADVENIQHLLNDFPHPKIIRLEQNYRSTSVILKAANAVIINNKKRLGKKLWTDSDGNEDELITLYGAYSEFDEAKYVINKIVAIKNTINNQQKLGETAILYRSNAQSRLFEEHCIQMQIPYRIYGGLRYFERAEIKDALAYLRLITNPHDDAALERIINIPTRGIGDTTLLQLRNYAQQQQVSWFIALQEILDKQLFATRAATAIKNFLELLQLISKQAIQLELYQLVAYVIKTSGLYNHFAKDSSEKNLMRIDNLEELVNATKQFAVNNKHDYEDNNISLLRAFLANAALESNDTERHHTLPSEDCVQLMTLHTAKGLEFNTVFLCGMEDGLFPHVMSLESPGGLEEERRLCYVGITRARRKLYLTWAKNRQLHGVSSMRRSSRFLKEIPAELITEDSILTKVQPINFCPEKNKHKYQSNNNQQYRSDNKNCHNNRDSDNTNHNLIGFKIGQKVKHQKFGEGTIVSFEGQGEYLLVQVKFTHTGTKWLSPQYAKLE